MTTNANRLHQVEGLLDAIIKSTTTHQIRAKAIDALAHVIKVRETLELHAEGLLTDREAGFSAPKQPVETKTRHKDRRYNQIKDSKRDLLHMWQV